MGEAIRTAVKAPETKKEIQVSQVQKGNFCQPLSSPVGQILFLQRTIGNQAVRRLMKSGALQAKLRIGAPDDVYEQEADRVAEQVMRMLQPQAVASETLSIQRACLKCEEEELKRQPIKEEDEEKKLRRKPVEDEEVQAKVASSSISEVNPDIESNIQSLKGGGKPLSENERAFFEPRFGHDFSEVRLHSGGAAGQSARDVDANAYTVGHNIVFGEGQFAPGTHYGRRLIAHELTHVVQQSGSEVNSLRKCKYDRGQSTIDRLEADSQASGEGKHETHFRTGALERNTLQRQATGDKKSQPPHITQILVNQNTPQYVTATFSDGHTEFGQCSTGKGHCCFDDSAGTAEGGTCSASRSKQVGNNCTPVGDFTVTAKIPVTGGGVRLWTQFHDAKSVALHEYSPVDGTPLSHGCVRMNEQMAQAVFDGARVGVTKVKVEGLARPHCEHLPLQNEWSDDFALAGSAPPDGQTIDPFFGQRLTPEEIAKERRHIRGAREEMRSAIGVDETGLDAELAAVRGGESIVSKIPRCVPTLTTEEQEVSSAKDAGFLNSESSATVDAFIAKLNRKRSEAGAEQIVRRTGEQLWQTATKSAHAGGTGTDDRQLYWMRLMLTTALRQWDPSWVPNADSLRRLQTRLLSLLEQTSRGMTASAFPTDSPDLKRILISGFDPFGFQNGGDIAQSNSSGAAAMALDGETLVQGAVSARVEGVVFPVRYTDFNEGIVENHLRPHLTGPQPPHLVMSISQGSTEFEFEEWAGRRRSNEYALDNRGLLGGGTGMRPIEAPGLASGQEFLPHNVPSAMLGSMRGVVGRTSAIPQETEVFDLPLGASEPRRLTGGPREDSGKAVKGSGGDFLSNEIFYRNTLLRTQTGSDVPMIHLHTPMLDPSISKEELITKRNEHIQKIREILLATILHLE